MGHFSEILLGSGHRQGKGTKPNPDNSWHTIDADVVDVAGGSIVSARPTKGLAEQVHGDEVVDVQFDGELLAGVYLHWRGHKERDLSIALLRLTVRQAASLSDGRQAQFLKRLCVPPGMNPPPPDVQSAIDTERAKAAERFLNEGKTESEATRLAGESVKEEGFWPYRGRFPGSDVPMKTTKDVTDVSDGTLEIKPQ